MKRAKSDEEELEFVTPDELDKGGTAGNIPIVTAYCGECKRDTVHAYHEQTFAFWICVSCGDKKYVG